MTCVRLRAALALAVLLMLGGCTSINPFCSIGLTGDFCPAVYRLNVPKDTTWTCGPNKERPGITCTEEAKR